MNLNGQTGRFLRFGPFELDTVTSELRKSGTPLKLNGQPLKLLILLARHPGQLVTRDQIRNEIWGEDTFIELDQSLNFCIKQIRGFLNDDAKAPRYVETVPRRGYRFVGHVELENSVSEQQRAAEPELPAAVDATARRHRTWLWPSFAVAAICTIVIATWAWWWPKPAPPNARIMLLVLPFDNLSGDKDQEYFSDGMTEEIITQLGRLDPKRLGVIARTSAMRYKYTAYDSRDVTEIGKEMGADYIVEGSVRQGNGRVRITARLNRVPDRAQVWTENYDRNLKDVLVLQDDVAESVANQVHLRISSARGAPRQISADVYDLYLRGRYFWNKRSRESMQRAASLFAEAVRRDPRYAAAHAGLADAYTALAHYGALAPADGYLKSKAAALKALELDPGLADAHTALAAVRVEYDWDWSAAKAGFERAVELNPSYPTAHQWFAHYWTAVGRPDQAVSQVQRALALDPLSPLINSALGRHLYHAGRYDEAIAQLRKALELDPGFALAHLHLGWAYEAKGMVPAAASEYEQAVALTGRGPAAVAALARTLATANPGEARRLTNELLRRTDTMYVPPFQIAVALAGTGDMQRASEWLDKACAERSPEVMYLRRHPWAAALARSQRYQRFVEALRLPRL